MNDKTLRSHPKSRPHSSIFVSWCDWICAPVFPSHVVDLIVFFYSLFLSSPPTLLLLFIFLSVHAQLPFLFFCSNLIITAETMSQHARNPGYPLDMGWVHSVRINMPAINRRAAEHMKRRSVKKKYQAAWLLRAVSVIDLTTLR